MTQIISDALYDENEIPMNLDAFIPDEDIVDENDSEDIKQKKDADSSEASSEYETYKVSALSPNFLKYECSIKLECSKTNIKFSYKGNNYKGIVMQQFGNSKEDYIMLVQTCDKKGKVIDPTKKMKKIHIPDVSLLK